jgi:enamine deaminase RidA (YjgF/YER057c/UK114 family)
MNVPVQPSFIASPAANYALATKVVAARSMLFTAGIVGTRPDGSTAEHIGDQAEEVWRSIGAILSEAGFEVADIVSYTTYAVHGEDLKEVMAARDRFFQEHRAASTLIPVPALARSEWKVEIAVVAAC